jgi:hypothetical protein
MRREFKTGTENFSWKARTQPPEALRAPDINARARKKSMRGTGAPGVVFAPCTAGLYIRLETWPDLRGRGSARKGSLNVHIYLLYTRDRIYAAFSFRIHASAIAWDHPRVGSLCSMLLYPPIETLFCNIFTARFFHPQLVLAYWTRTCHPWIISTSGVLKQKRIGFFGVAHECWKHVSIFTCEYILDHNRPLEYAQGRGRMLELVPTSPIWVLYPWTMDIKMVCFLACPFASILISPLFSAV